VHGRFRTGDAWVALLPWLVVGLEAALAVAFVVDQAQGNARGIDFQLNVWEPVQRLADGSSPYAPPGTLAERGATYGYPPLTALVFLPLAVLPYKAALALFALMLAAASVGAVWAVGVRSLPCLLLVLFSLPVVGACYWGNPSPLVVLAGALAWRWRDSRWRAPLAVALGTAIKFLLWPLVAWLALTGRAQAALRAVALALVAILLPWALIGFDGFTAYPDLLRELRDAGAGKGLLAHAAAERLGAPTGVATAVGLALAIGLLAVAARVRTDRSAFGLAILAGLLASPLAWSYYLAAFAVLIAIWRPAFSPIWLVVPAIWLDADIFGITPGLTNALGLGLCALLTAWLVQNAREYGAPPLAPVRPTSTWR
jgi:alpha-1,2-mannosyltransferase